MKKMLAALCVLILFTAMLPGAMASDSQLDVLRVGIAVMQDNYDPSYAMGIQNIKIYYNVFDTLLTTDKDGSIKGQLAESWEWLDSQTLNVTIHDGVTFHNGEPCTSEDVWFTFDRILTGVSDGTIAVLYESLESVEILDELTVQFKLKIPDQTFEERLSSVWGANIVPKDYMEAVGNEAFQTAPVGSGPFSMTYSPEKIVLTRYEDFWGTPPNVGTIELILYPETSARVIALVNGEVDIINDVTADMVDTINSYDGLSVQGTAVKNIHIYVFNTKGEGIMSNEKFRQALTIAMDRQIMIDAFWSDHAYVPQGHQFPSYGDLFIEDYAGIAYDPDLARQLVEESGYDGEEIVIQMQHYYTNGEQAGEAIVSMWRDIGINARVEYVERLSWDFPQIRAWSSASRFDNPLGALWMLFGTGSSPANNSWDVTDAFAAAAETLMINEDLEARREAARTLLEVFDTVCPGTYLYMAEELYGIRDGFDWDLTYAENQITPFRAEDFKLAE